jgi:hypothetical protein
MAKNYERDEREEYWRRPQQNRESQERWSGGGRENERYDDYDRGRWQEMQGRGRGEDERGWEGGPGRQWGNEDYNYGRERNWGMQGGNWESPQGNRRWEGGQRGMMGMREREGQWEGGWQNRGQDNWRQNQSGRWGRGDERGMEGSFTGRGPRAYKRSDERIEEDINERLTQHPMLDASDIEVTVQNAEVTLRGHVDHREAKRMAEDIVEGVFGVKDVNNQIKVKQRGETEEGRHETETSGKRERKAS